MQMKLRASRFACYILTSMRSMGYQPVQLNDPAAVHSVKNPKKILLLLPSALDPHRITAQLKSVHHEASLGDFVSKDRACKGPASSSFSSPKTAR